MQSTPTRATDGANPASTDGTSHRRARRWPLRAGILAMAAIAVAAPMVAAEPASAPVQPTAVAAVAADAVIETTTTTEAGPTQAEIDAFNEAVRIHRANERLAAEEAARKQAGAAWKALEPGADAMVPAEMRQALGYGF